MTAAGGIQQLFRDVRHEQVKVASFRPGQVFYGKVTKLYPNQMAEVTVGSQKLVAQLETPLSAGDRYWFQVQPGEGKVHLKVLATVQGTEAGKMTEAAADILSRLALPQSKEMLQLAQFLMKEQLPMTRDMLTIASEFMKQTGDVQASLQAMKEVMNQQLPFTKEVLASILATRNAVPVHELIAQLQTQLSKGPQSDVARQLSALLTEMNAPMKEKAGDLALQQLVEKWMNGTAQEQKTALRLLQDIGLLPRSTNEQTTGQQMLKTIVSQLVNNPQLAPQQKQELVLLQQIVTALGANNRSEAIPALQQLMQMNKGEVPLRELAVMPSGRMAEQAVKQVLQRAIEGEAPRPNVVSQQASQTSTEAGRHPPQVISLLMDKEAQLPQMRSAAANMLENVFPLKGNSVETTLQLGRQELQMLRGMEQQLNEMMPKWESKAYVQQALNNIVKSLGLNYENNLVSSKLANIEESLKPMLMRFIAEQQQGMTGKSHAEQLVHRLTGLQLQSQEIGPMQQTLLQMPVQLWNKTVDLTMQWSGQKTEDGKIDPNYCRVLFYLELEHIDETIIDMQVQNRVMSIAIMNDRTDLKEVGRELLATLKTNIEAGHYTVSSVSFRPLHEEEQQIARPQTRQQENQYTGFDIRI